MNDRQPAGDVYAHALERCEATVLEELRRDFLALHMILTDGTASAWNGAGYDLHVETERELYRQAEDCLLRIRGSESVSERNSIPEIMRIQHR